MLEREIEDYFGSVVAVAQEVGKIIKDAFYQEKRVDTKSGMADLVTETDKLVEEIIIKTLKTKYPTHSFIGEESVVPGVKCELTDNPTWVIDPIDGTTNFVHRFPFIAVSIGLLVKKETVIGLVYNPILNEMYTAKKGQGAYCNGKKLQVTKTEELGNALICAEFGSSRDKDILDSKFRSMRNVIDRSHGMRQTGSAALHMCLVAAGSADGHFTQGIHIWDIAAGLLIVREAGGVVYDTQVKEQVRSTEGTTCGLVNCRSIGSAACNMSNVASGKLDAYYEQGIHCWDIAAGHLIVTEAGGVVYNIKGGPLDLMSRRMLCAGTEKLAQEIAKHVEAIEYERD